MAPAHGYDAIVLDVMLRGSTARDLPAAARGRVWAPVLMLTARDAVEDASPASTRARTTT